MKNLTNKELLNICTKDYFENVDKKNIQEVLSTMHHDAIIEIKTDNLIHSGRDSEIKKMLNGYFEAFPKLWHGDFSPVVDEQRQIVVLQFNWSIVNTKEEGLELIRSYNGEYPKRWMKELCEYLTINPNESPNIKNVVMKMI